MFSVSSDGKINPSIYDTSDASIRPVVYLKSQVVGTKTEDGIWELSY